MTGKANLAGFEKYFATGGLPELGPGPRREVLPHEQLDKPLEKLLAETPLPTTARDLIRALILLWHDRLDAAHAIAQGIEDADGSFVHGIVHRRQRDYGNAKYWFRRVGSHPAFPQIADRVGELPSVENNGALRDELIPHSEWDAFAFIDWCEKSASKPATDPQVKLLRMIQGIESQVLLEYFLNS
ncbi:MAG: hypothetical protein JWR19_1920 [Pedosphaera sp.]|nr:hypothetical protein [Pedosphaera sp.]